MNKSTLQSIISISMLASLLYISSCSKDESTESITLTNKQWIYQDVNSSTDAIQQAVFDSWVGKKLKFSTDGSVTTTFSDGHQIEGEWKLSDDKKTLTYQSFGPINLGNKGTEWGIIELSSGFLIVSQKNITLKFSH
jgi:hypothetical protein